MEHKNIVYGYCDPDGSLRYVGKTVGYLSVRHAQHRIRALEKTADGKWKCSIKFYNWFRKHLRETGQEPKPFVIEAGVPNLAESEIFYISYFTYIGANLLNLTVGGEGCVGYKHTAKSLELIKINNRRPRNRVYRPHTYETKVAIICTKTGLLPGDLLKMAKMYAEGSSSYEVASEFEVSATCVETAVTMHGGKMRTGGETKRTLTPEQRLAAIQMYLSGYSCAKVGKAFGLTDSGVRGILEVEGVQRRNRGKVPQSCRKE
jgi:hypothetical protein